MEAAIQKNTNDELKTLQLKLEILEEELRKAHTRADQAESELEKYKNLSSYHIASIAPPPPPKLLLPPPPPPPLPPTLLYKPVQNPLMFKRPGAMEECASDDDATTSEASGTFAFTDNIKSSHVKLSKGSGSAGGGNKIIGTVKQQVQPEAATGRSSLHNTTQKLNAQTRHCYTHLHILLYVCSSTLMEEIQLHCHSLIHTRICHTYYTHLFMYISCKHTNPFKNFHIQSE